MAMTKAEMEAHRTEYFALMGKARAAQQDGLYRKAIELALASYDHIDGMMQYERRYEEREFDSVESIDLILKYAPVLFDFPSLDALEDLLKTQRRIEKNTSDDLGERLSNARTLMWDAHRMWDHLEQHPEARQDDLRHALGGDQDRWRSVAERWAKMGLLHRTPEGNSYRLALCTRMGQVVSGKCFSCGAVAEAPKAMFMEELACPDCRTRGLFVIIETSKEKKE